MNNHFVEFEQALAREGKSPLTAKNYLNDLKHFAATFVDVMWNGSLEHPTVGGWVNTNKPSRQSGNLHEWLRLGAVEPKVRPICERVILPEGSLWAKAQLYRLWANERKAKS